MFGVFKVNGIFRSTPVESNGCKLAKASVKPVIWDWDKTLIVSEILSIKAYLNESFVSSVQLRMVQVLKKKTKVISFEP